MLIPDQRFPGQITPGDRTPDKLSHCLISFYHDTALRSSANHVVFERESDHIQSVRLDVLGYIYSLLRSGTLVPRKGFPYT